MAAMLITATQKDQGESAKADASIQNPTGSLSAVPPRGWRNG
jgi:hypothetical protein